MQKADLRHHLEQVYSNIELEQWFDPLDVRVNTEEQLIQVDFPHIFFARQFRHRFQVGFENHIQPFFQGWRLHWGEPVHAPADIPTFPTGKSPRSRNTLLPRHTFASFLHNRKNDFPVAAALAAATAMHSPPYMPLVIYGQSGAGKTHLLGAIANEAQEHFPDLNFFYGPAQSLPADTSFQAVFLDDMHLAQSPEAQSYFARLLDSLIAEGGSFICTADAPPASSQIFCRPLAQRLSAGLVVELKKPDIEVRRRYATSLCDTFSLNAGKDETLSLAQRYTDFRAIDGAVNRARAYSSLLPDKNAKSADIFSTGMDHKALTPDQIIAVVARFFSSTPEQLTGKSRDKTAGEARRYAVVLCRELLGISLPRLGVIFGGRDHSSIVYTIKKFKEIQDTNKDMHTVFSRLKQMCLTPGP